MSTLNNGNSDHFLSQLVEDHADRLGRVETATAEIGPAVAGLAEGVRYLTETVREVAQNVKEIRATQEDGRDAASARDSRLQAIESRLELQKGRALAVVKWLAGVAAAVTASVLAALIVLKSHLRP